MHRWGLRILGLLITASVLLMPAVFALIPDTPDAGPDPVRISNYDADFSVSDDGTLQATETLTTEFPSGRHGIFRYWDVQDPSDSSVRLVPQDIEVTLDGKPEPFDLSSTAGWRFRVAKIGDADTYLSAGTHVYTISYRIDGVLAPTDVGQGEFSSSSWTDERPASSVFYWNVVAPGWGMAIDQSTVTIDLPVDSGLVQCTTGYGTFNSPTGTCAITGGGTQQVTVETGALAPRTPVTVRIGQATPLPDRQTLPWPTVFDQSLGRSLPTAVVLGLLAFVALVVAYRWERASREDEPGFGVAYDPPPGLGPMQTAYVMTERVPDKALVATLLYQAEQGLTTLEQDDASWIVTGVGDTAAWAATDDVTRYVGEQLGVTTPGAIFTSGKGKVASGLVLQGTQKGLSSVADTWASGVGAQQTAPSEQTTRAIVIVAAVIAIGITVLIAFVPAVFMLPFAAFFIGGAGLLTKGVGRRRTSLGRELWSHAGGFRRLLSTDSAQDRFDFSGHTDLYTSFIPYAVVFDCADRWASKYEMTTGSAAPVPTWYAGGTPTSSGSSLFGGGRNDPYASFESSLSSSISAYAATQSSSSSGGGGGGGSW